jgi:PAS domain S-box-containing protein
MKDKNEFLQKIISNPDIILLLNSIYDGVYIVNTEREIVFWNKGAAKLTGHAKKEVLDKKCSDNILNHIDENGNLLCSGNCPLMECMIQDKNVERKIYPLTKTKKRFPVLTRVGPIKDHDGEIVGAIEVFRDISKDEDLRILQEKFNDLIKKYVSSTTYENVIREARSGKTGMVKMCELTVLYVDVVGFCSFAGRNDLPEVAAMLNDVFGLCEIITKKYHGDIDKFIGDAVMATFIDANDAVKAAENILSELKVFNMQRIKEKKEPVHLHIGINSGNVIRAEIGTSERKDLTVLGNTVNLAARIQEISEPDKIFISESTYSRLKNTDGFSFFEKITFKGQDLPIPIFRSVG